MSPLPLSSASPPGCGVEEGGRGSVFDVHVARLSRNSPPAPAGQAFSLPVVSCLGGQGMSAPTTPGDWEGREGLKARGRRGGTQV